MNEDGKIVINTELNTEGVDKGLQNLNKNLKANTSEQKLNIASLAKMGTAIGAVAAATKVASKAIKECTEAYKVQAKAEVQLEQAAKNNPYLDSSSVKKLKNYASELQSISVYGDEQLIPFMAQLASAGRTQSEIMDIMSASIDVASSGVMSLDEAVANLNRTYSGQIGRLGMTIPQVKNLTEEQLKNGEATKIVAEQFKGMAEETAKATGSSQQLKNAWGDLKEELGAPFEKALTPMRKFFKGLISGWAEAIKKKREYKEIDERINNDSGTIEDYKNKIAKEQLILKEKQEEYELQVKQNEAMDNSLDIEKAKQDVQIQLEKVTALQEQLKTLEEIANAEKEQKEAESENNKIKQEQATAYEKAAKAKLNYLQTVQKAEDEIKLRKKLGAQITEEEEAQTMLNVRMSAYLKMIEEAEGAISGNTGFAKDEAERIAAENARLNPGATIDGFEDVNKIVSQWQTEEQNSLEHQKAMLDIYEDYLNKKKDKTAEEIELYNQVAEAQENINKAIAQKQKDQLAQNLSDINDYVSEFAQITQSMTSLVQESNERETEAEMSALSKQYTDGLISYEQYEEKKKEINKKAAEEQYKLDMWNWTSSLLQATANIAEGVSKAIAQGGVAGIVTGALVAASGAIQIASITANKPVRPSFATGGIVGGSSYHGDNVQGNLNSREMILNYGQQKNLFDAINRGNMGGNGGANVTMPVTINNNSSANVSSKMDKNGLIVMIDEVVNSSMQAGKYTQSMNIAQSKSNGVSLY